MNDDKRYAYITYHDLRNSLSYKQTTMVIKAPPESKLEVPEVISNKEEKQVKIYVIHKNNIALLKEVN